MSWSEYWDKRGILEAPQPTLSLGPPRPALTRALVSLAEVRAATAPRPRTDPATRELLQRLGDSFSLMKPAHQSVQRALKAGAPESLQRAAVRQWAYAVQQYAHALEDLLQPLRPAEPAENAEHALGEVRTQVLGRIVGGRFVRP